MKRLSLTLPNYEAAINRLCDEVHDRLHMQDEILKLFPRVYLVHAGITRLVSSPSILDKPMELHKTKFNMEPDMFLQTDVSKFRDIILGMTNDLLDQQRKQTAEVMLETGEAAGNSIDGKERNFWDTYIEMLQNTPYSQHGYQLFMNPNTEKSIKETPQTPVQRQKIEEVNRAKRDEYIARKRSRHLS